MYKIAHMLNIAEVKCTKDSLLGLDLSTIKDSLLSLFFLKDGFQGCEPE